MKDQPNEYESKVEDLIAEWNAEIENLEVCAREAEPELRQKCREEISELILKRESLRRGLTTLREQEDLGSSYPQ